MADGPGLGSAELVAFVPTTDLPRAREFFQGALGLTVVHEDPFACVFDAHGTTLRVTPVEDHTVEQFTILGWTVPDIAATVRALGARGVEFNHYGWPGQDELGVWTGPGGAQVAWFRDPDGNTLSVTQEP